VVARREESLPGTELPLQAERLSALGAEVLICGAISRPMAGLLAATNINVIPFIAGDEAQILGAWLLGTLPSPAWSMPGCCGQRRRCHGGKPGLRNGRGWTGSGPSGQSAAPKG